MGYHLQPSVNKNVDWYYMECNFVRNMGFEFGQGLVETNSSRD